MAQGLFRKKGYFSEEGLDRQLQDLEQDVDDSLRALSEQIDDNASEGARQIADVQTQITRTAGTASSASSSTAALDTRVTALEVSRLPSAQFVFSNNSGETYTVGSLVKFNTTASAQDPQGIDLVDFDLSNPDTLIKLPSDGLYQFQGEFAVESASATSGTSAVLAFKAYDAPGDVTPQELARSEQNRLSTNTSDRIWVKFSFSLLVESASGLYVGITNQSPATLTAQNVSDISNRIYVVRLGNAP